MVALVFRMLMLLLVLKSVLLLVMLLLVGIKVPRALLCRPRPRPRLHILSGLVPAISTPDFVSVFLSVIFRNHVNQSHPSPSSCMMHMSQLPNENTVHLSPSSSHFSSNEQRILSWVKHIQKGDFAPFDTASPVTPPVSRKRKRIAMAETSGNERMQTRRSPRKPLRIDRTDDAASARTPTTPQRCAPTAHILHSAEDDLENDTPRASISSRRGLALDPSNTFLPPSFTAQRALVESPSLDRDRSISGDSEESGGIQSGGSRSPLRCWADFAAADTPTIYTGLDGKVARQIGGVLVRYQELRNASMGIGVIPHSLKVSIGAPGFKTASAKRNADSLPCASRNLSRKTWMRMITHRTTPILNLPSLPQKQ